MLTSGARMLPLSPMALLLAACAGPPVDTAATVDPACAAGPAVTWAWADGFFTTWCRSCHSANTPDRRGAPVGVDFDTESDVRASAAAVRSAVIEREAMPIGGGVYPDDLVILDRYLACSLGSP